MILTYIILYILIGVFVTGIFIGFMSKSKYDLAELHEGDEEVIFMQLFLLIFWPLMFMILLFEGFFYMENFIATVIIDIKNKNEKDG